MCNVIVYTISFLFQTISIMNLIKLTDMFSLATWKFLLYIDEQLPTYFARMNRLYPLHVRRSGIRSFIYQIIIKLSFGEQSIGYHLIKQLNAEERSALTTN